MVDRDPEFLLRDALDSPRIPGPVALSPIASRSFVPRPDPEARSESDDEDSYSEDSFEDGSVGSAESGEAGAEPGDSGVEADASDGAGLEADASDGAGLEAGASDGAGLEPGADHALEARAPWGLGAAAPWDAGARESGHRETLTDGLAGLSVVEVDAPRGSSADSEPRPSEPQSGAPPDLLARYGFFGLGGVRSTGAPLLTAARASPIAGPTPAGASVRPEPSPIGSASTSALRPIRLGRPALPGSRSESALPGAPPSESGAPKRRVKKGKKRRKKKKRAAGSESGGDAPGQRAGSAPGSMLPETGRARRTLRGDTKGATRGAAKAKGVAKGAAAKGTTAKGKGTGRGAPKKGVAPSAKAPRDSAKGGKPPRAARASSAEDGVFRLGAKRAHKPPLPPRKAGEPAPKKAPAAWGGGTFLERFDRQFEGLEKELERQLRGEVVSARW